MYNAKQDKFIQNLNAIIRDAIFLLFNKKSIME